MRRGTLIAAAVATVAAPALAQTTKPANEEIASMATATQSRTVKSRDGTSIAYDKAGSGPVLIVVSGASQFRAINPTFAEIARVLSDQFTVINYDRRGRGESGDTPPYTVQKEIDDIAALIAANGGRASVIGFSSGAVLAIEAAVAGLPIDKVIAYEPPIAVKGSGRETNWGDLTTQMEAALARRDRREVTRIFFVEGVSLPADVYEGMMKPPSGPGLEAIAPTLIYDSKIVDGAYANQKWPDRYRTNKVPVLLLNGDKTFPFIPLAADALSRVLAKSSRGTLPGQDHGPKPEAIAPAIRKFLGA